ncbi:MAG: hypothetical protein V3U84_00200 [Thiotrichaceae bacterium]
MSKLALQLIAEAKEKRLTTLDLGNCGLTEIPEEVFELVWLEELSLSNGYFERNTNGKGWKRIASKNQGERNFLSVIPQAFSQLQKLKNWYCQVVLETKHGRFMTSMCSANSISSRL